MQIAQKNFYKKFLGRVGEKKAVEYLKEQGYKILDKNYKTRVGEIDIVAKIEDEIVFVEVKTRSSDRFGSPSLAVNYEKQRKYFSVATSYLIKNFGTEDKNCRFDVVEIEDGKINHIINAFSR